MKFGMGSNMERTQKGQSTNDIRTSTHNYKQTSPIFNCVTPESVSLAFIGVNLGVTSHLTKSGVERSYDGTVSM